MTTEPTRSVLLDARNLVAGYGPVIAISDLSVSVAAGEIVAVIGGNGAGKSTTLRTLCGLVPASKGSVHFAGEDTTGLPAHALVARGMAMVPEGRRIFPRLSVMDNLRLGAFLHPRDQQYQRDLDHAFALFPILADRRHQAGGTLSGGEQQMLAIARALMSRPRLLLMDEPSMGVAPLIVEKIFTAITTLNQEGLSILLVEQNARAALEIAHRGYVLETGRVALKGLAGHLINDERVRAAYLGG